MQSDAGKCSLLLLLYPTLVFDTVDHSILLNRLKCWASVSGSALNLIHGFVSCYLDYCIVLYMYD